MQFQSPLAEIGYLYNDYSEEHQATHPESTRSLEEREIEVKRVRDISKNPYTGENLPPEAIPANAIASRIGHDVQVESFAFRPTSRELLALMNQFADDFAAIIERFHVATTHHIKQMRDAFHFAFDSVTPPGTKETFFEQKSREANEDALFTRRAAWKELVHHCQEFLDNVHPTLTLKEIKIFPDGHVVFRMTIREGDLFLNFRNKWLRLFNANYVRYPDPERVLTRACVIGVVNKYSLPLSAQQALESDLNELFLKYSRSLYNKAYPFDVIEISEASNRMLQKKDMYGLLRIERGFRRLNARMIEDHTPVDPKYRPHAEVVSAHACRGFFKRVKPEPETQQTEQSIYECTNRINHNV